MIADRSACRRCGSVTRWLPVRGGARLRCEGCADVFPCRHACRHLDCADVRTTSNDSAIAAGKLVDPKDAGR